MDNRIYLQKDDELKESRLYYMDEKLYGTMRSYIESTKLGYYCNKIKNIGSMGFLTSKYLYLFSPKQNINVGKNVTGLDNNYYIIDGKKNNNTYQFRTVEEKYKTKIYYYNTENQEGGMKRFKKTKKNKKRKNTKRKNTKRKN